MVRGIIVLLLLFNSKNLWSQATDTALQRKIYNERIQKTRIADVYIPMNTNDAMNELLRLSDSVAREKIKTTKEDTIASKLHFSLGRWMQINWGFDEGSRLSHYYRTKGVTYTDDMIDLLIRSFYRTIVKQPIEEEKLIQKYIDLRKQENIEKKKKAKVVQTITRTKKPHNE
ncbi:MAG: hypothetical protein IPG55_03005 [Saprospiraceae bacterium]|nr:hypothetical protein [Candidatus Defluviibacterium haderslevense]MBK7244609.1 hypothetical protein [Candidatus Defluviibacterium haderslevense]